jgi:hypothetical protein
MSTPTLEVELCKVKSNAKACLVSVLFTSEPAAWLEKWGLVFRLRRVGRAWRPFDPSGFSKNWSPWNKHGAESGIVRW